MNRYLAIAVFLLFPSLLRAQEHPSIHQIEYDYYQRFPERVSTPENHSVHRSLLERRSSSLNAVVYGFHPYWENGSEANYDFSLLSHLAYFSCDVDENTGNFSSTHNYSTASVITAAKNAGVKVHLTITSFSNHTALFSSQANVDRLVNNIIAKIKERNIDGVNIDFESMSSSHAAPFKSFILQLGDSLQKMNKDLVVELFAVDWQNIFPASFFADANAVVDHYFIMLYAYYYSGSPTAGPNAPLRSSTASGYHVLKSIDTYLAKGCPKEKLIAGFPYYGFDWPVVSSARMATATGTGNSREYHIVKNDYIDTIPKANQFFDATYSTPWYRYVKDTVWRQGWYDDSLSLALKYDSVKSKKIAGVGMWALGYDGAEPELWSVLEKKFTSSTNVRDHDSRPETFSLSQNYPNPFNPSTTIIYTIPEDGMVSLSVFDMLGRTVAEPVNGYLRSGSYQLQWNAPSIASGIYFYRLVSSRGTITKKMMLMK